MCASKAQSEDKIGLAQNPFVVYYIVVIIISII
jgi:hypothetical protein